MECENLWPQPQIYHIHIDIFIDEDGLELFYFILCEKGKMTTSEHPQLH